MSFEKNLNDLRMAGRESSKVLHEEEHSGDSIASEIFLGRIKSMSVLGRDIIDYSLNFGPGGSLDGFKAKISSILGNLSVDQQEELLVVLDSLEQGIADGQIKVDNWGEAGKSAGQAFLEILQRNNPDSLQHHFPKSVGKP